MVANVYDSGGQKLREQDLPDALFGVEPNRPVMHQALVRQLANARQGTHATKTRGEINRTTRKWFRQKGTGNARHGSRRAPIFVGGGIAHGPKPRDYNQRMPKRMRRLALRSALSAKAADNAVVLVEGLALDSPKTGSMAALLRATCGDASVLFLLPGRDEAVERSVRNIGNAKYLHAAYVNMRDLLGYDRLVIPLEALSTLEAHLGGPADAGPEGSGG